MTDTSTSISESRDGTVPSDSPTSDSLTSDSSSSGIYETQPERADLPLAVMPAVLASMVGPLEERFSTLHDIARVRMHLDFTEDEDVLAARMSGADVMFNGGPHISDRLLHRLCDPAEGGSVRCIVFSGTGVASYINLDLARRLGVRVCNARHYGDNAVAEHTFALIFEVLRHVGELDAVMKHGGWSTPAADGMQLAGRRLGIIGLDGIGSTVARIARAFGMDVSAWWTGHTPVERFVQDGVTPVADLGELIGSCDIVSVHLPLIDGATRGIITAADLDRLRPGAIFVNTARAEVIEPGAVTARLMRGDVLAALDVYEREPLPADDPLRTLPGVVLTPHVAWRTDGAFADLTRQMVECAASFLTGGRMNVVVDERTDSGSSDSGSSASACDDSAAQGPYGTTAPAVRTS